ECFFEPDWVIRTTTQTIKAITVSDTATPISLVMIVNTAPSTISTTQLATTTPSTVQHDVTGSHPHRHPAPGGPSRLPILPFGHGRRILSRRPAVNCRYPLARPTTDQEPIPVDDTTQRRFAARDLAQVAVFAALIIVLGFPGQFTVGSAGVPITLQTLGVMLAGAILGWRKGVASVLVVIVLSLGLPILAGWRTGLSSLAGPTAGFLIGWIPAVLVIGALTQAMMPRYRFFT